MGALGTRQALTGHLTQGRGHSYHTRPQPLLASVGRPCYFSCAAMRIDEEARQLGQVDVSPLRDFISAGAAKLWHFHCDMPALAACDRIILRHSRDYDFDFNDIVDWPLHDEFRALTDPILKQVTGALGKSKISALFVANLPAGEFIYPHVDKGEFLSVPSRIHIPLRTNPEVVYYIGGVYVDSDDPDRMNHQQYAREVRMAEGEIWEIDNMSYHSVANRGTSDRWHLIANIW